MTKRFCDYCKKVITRDSCRVLTLSDADGAACRVFGQLQNTEVSIDCAEICVDCAQKIVAFTQTLTKEFLYA